MTIEDSNEEWKEVWNRDWLKPISAFYNTSGGRLVIGRADDGSFVGVDDPKDTLKTVSDTIRNLLNIPVDVHSEDFDGKTCIVVIVPEGNRPVSYDGRYYKRIGNTTRRLEGDALQDFLLSKLNRFWMDEPSFHTVGDVSGDAVEFFIRKGVSVGRIPEGVDASDTDWVLNRYGLVSGDGVTVAAMLLFSEHPRRINDGAFLKIGEFGSDGRLLREDIVEKPLIMVPDEAMEILYGRYIPPHFDYVGEASRRVVYDYPRDSVRELIVNAIVHMDYRAGEPVTVSVYPNRIEVFSHGGLPEGWTVDRLKSKHDSVRRNKTLANVFHDAGYVENWAQGIGKVLRECRINGNPEPSFIDGVDGLRVTVRPRSVTDTPMLTERQVRILDIIASDSNVSAAGIAEALGVSVRTVYTELSNLSGMGMIEREGSRKKGGWRITDAYSKSTTDLS